MESKYSAAGANRYGSYEYNVDLVFCIDATNSMTKLIDMVKDQALHFHVDLSLKMKEKRKKINRLRIRLVAFRDYLNDGDDAMLETRFFTLPDEADLFKICVDGIVAFGGGDLPEDGLEALAYAIRSPWAESDGGIKARQVIVVWTDAATHELGFGGSAANYPNDMPKSFAELTEWWGDGQNQKYMDYSSKRLLLYAPAEPYWSTITSNWENALHFPSIAGQGCKEVQYDEILDVIANSITQQVQQ